MPRRHSFTMRPRQAGQVLRMAPPAACSGMDRINESFHAEQRTAAKRIRRYLRRGGGRWSLSRSIIKECDIIRRYVR